MRPLARLGENLAPGLTGRIAFRLFCTPPRPKQGNHRAASVKSLATRLEAGTPLSVPFPCSSVAARLFEPPQRDGVGTLPCVILLHGWTGQAAVMAAFIKPLLKAGLRVVAFDLPAHGDSTGATLDLPTGVASLAAVARAVGPVEAIVAHSFGGSIALAALAGTLPAQPRIVARRLVLIAPPSSMREVAGWFGARIGLGPRGLQALEARIHTVAGVPVTAFAGAAQLQRYGGPTLLLHCRDDREVPFAHAQALADAGPFVRLEAQNGLGHRRILTAPRVVALVADFVTGRAEPALDQTQPINSRRTTASIASTPAGESFRQGR
ncbi:alpha/beta fold hydrolase [Bosea sp. OAE506]|uniref:alpha/beta fold hydrolase n=1 Tax=Bosea sp. OAE506 TaxID=2663870 RepID=UPI00178BCFDA